MSRTPIYNGLAQSDLDMNHFSLLNWTDPGGGGGGGSVSFGVRVSVKDAPYNAVGDGVTDDTVAIQAAINAVVAAGGGTVFIPHGIYLCNGAFDSSTHSILKIPLNGPAGGPVSLQLVGEDMPSWNAAGVPRNFMYFSTIKTTRTDGMTVDTNGFAAVIAGNVPFGNALHSAYADMSSVMTRIRNLQFLVPDDPTMGAIRLDGVGLAFAEQVLVNTATDTVQPTHGTTAVWMPNAINWSTSWLNQVYVAGFDTGFKLAEHTRAPTIMATACKTGVAFLDSMYPSWANIMCTSCADAVTFLGNHTVELLVEIEHGISGWTGPLHDIKDPSNYGTGTARVYLGHGSPGSACSTLSIQGGSGLTIVDLCSGNISLNTTTGASGGAGTLTGKVLATSLLIGYTDTGLARNNTSVLEVNNGTPGTFAELLARSVKHNAVTVATLPASPSIGQVASVSDGTAALAWGATVTGGGSNKYLVWWNGANWTVIAK